MKVSRDNDSPYNNITPESEAEATLLRSDIIASKLCFREARNGDNRLLSIGSGDFEFDSKKSTLSFPNWDKNLSTTSYFLRIALDFLSINHGDVPLHASAFKYRDKTAICIAESRKGKSLTLEGLSNNRTYIGDDHIIVGNNKIIGNSKMRKRGPDGDEYEASGDDVSNLDDYFIFYIDAVCDKNTTREIATGDRDYSLMLNEGLSYLLQEPHGKRAKEAFSKMIHSVTEKTWNLFDNFQSNSNGIYLVKGTPVFVNERISEVLDHEK